MKIFAFEYFSGGGLAGRPLPPAIAHEGHIMLATLVHELSEAPGVEIVTSRDPRLPPLPGCATIPPLPGEDARALYARGLLEADTAWPTAPESDGILEGLVTETVARGKMLLGCSPSAVRLTASKRATATRLRDCGIPAIPTFTVSDALPPLPGPWVIKPDGGAGCEDIRLVADWAAARESLGSDPDRLVAQPWVDGDSLSLSLLCASGDARLLACNRQRVTTAGDGLFLEGLMVNAVADSDGRLAALADRIVTAIPELWGYVGVDLVLSRSGPVVLEINPRLTTSYCGLRSALGINIAALVLDLACTGRLPAHRFPAGSPVEIRLGHTGDA